MTIHRAIAPEKRAFMRVPVALAGKLFTQDREQDCIVTDISLGGATLHCDERPGLGTEVVLFLPGFDRFTGIIVRAGDDEAGLHFTGSPEQRERTASGIMLYLSGVAPRPGRLRRAAREAAGVPRRFTRPDGEVVAFILRDISLTGASLQTGARPPLGEVVALGRMKARIARYLDDGIALEFV